MRRRRVSLTIIAIVATFACRGERGPRVEPYVVAVTAEEPALSAHEIESSVAIPIEMALGKIRSVISVRTESRAGVAIVVAELTDDTARGEARAQLEAIRAQLPASVMPVIQLVAPDAPDDLVFAVRGTHRPDVLTRVADDWIRSRIERIAGVGSVDVRGGQERKLEVRIDPKRLDAVGATVLDVTRALAGALDLPAGRLGTSPTPANPGDVWPELRDRVVVAHAGAPVRVADVATIAETLHPAHPEPLQIGIRFMRGADRARVTKAIADAMRTELPEGVTFHKGRPAPRPARVTLIGDDPIVLAQARDRLARELAIEVSREPEIELQIDRERAAALGISVNEVASTIAAVRGRPVMEASASTDIMMRLDGVALEEVVDVLRIRGTQGTVVPLRAVVTERHGQRDPVRIRIDQRPAVELTVPGGDIADLRRRVAKLGLPAQIRTRVQ